MVQPRGEGADKPSRERGRGYRDGLRACGIEVEKRGAGAASQQPRRTKCRGDATRIEAAGYLMPSRSIR
jgi:hypothetical protein